MYLYEKDNKKKSSSDSDRCLVIPSVFKTKRTFERYLIKNFFMNGLQKMNAALAKMYCSR